MKVAYRIREAERVHGAAVFVSQHCPECNRLKPWAVLECVGPCEWWVEAALRLGADAILVLDPP